MSQLEGASYRVRFPASFLGEAGLTPETPRGRLHPGSGSCWQECVVVRRTSEDKVREFDARPSVAALEVIGEESPAALDMHLRFAMRPCASRRSRRASFPRTSTPAPWMWNARDLWVEREGHRFDPMEALQLR